MSNDEMLTFERRFVIRAWSFLRHWTFVLRHLAASPKGVELRLMRDWLHPHLEALSSTKRQRPDR